MYEIDKMKRKIAPSLLLDNFMGKNASKGKTNNKTLIKSRDKVLKDRLSDLTLYS